MIKFKAIASALGLLAIVAGVPALLVAIGANPIPSMVPSFDAIADTLMSPDDGSFLLFALAVVAWAAWAVLAASILIEAVAAVRGVGAPRIAGLRLGQAVIRPLVATAALLIVSAPLLGSHVAQAAPAHTITSTSAPAAPSNEQTSVAADVPLTTQQTPQAAEGPATQYTHVVKPGESLWSLAESVLGDGARFPEIVELNHDLLEGRASFIEPGWKLNIPAPVATPTSHTVVAGDTLSQIALDELGDANRYPEIFDASRTITQPDGTPLSDPDVIDVGQKLVIPDPTSSVEPAASQSAPEPPIPPASDPQNQADAVPEPQAAPETAQAPAATSTPTTPEQSPAASQADDEASAWPSRTEYGVGGLLAAGVITLIAARRRTQQRRRRPGQQIPMPTAETADLEHELRVVADSISVEAVGTALRSLAQECAATSSPLPVVRAGRLTATQFDLYLDEPATLPAPWTGTADATVWTLQVDNTGDLDAAAVADVPSPYPALVTIGHDTEGGHVFLDLEYLGALGVVGDEDQTREILTALAVELSTSSWADDLQVTVVGACAGLEDALQTGRIRYLPTAGRILEDLEARADGDRAALAEDTSPDLNHARVTGAAPDAWTPEIVLLAGPITARQRNQINNLVDQLPRVALAAVTSGVAVGEWALQLEENSDLAVLAPIGLQLRPQRIPAEQYTHILEMAALAGDPPEDTEYVAGAAPEPSLTDLEAITGEPETTTPPAENVPPTEEVPATEGDPEAEDLINQPVVDEPDPPSAQDTAVDGTDPESSAVEPLPLPAPMVLVLGEPDVVNATGKIEPSKRSRRIELAAYLALHPGATHTAIDDAIWPARKTTNNLNTRNTATSKLRSWLGKTPDGEDYLPRHQAGGGYSLLPAVRSDIDIWDTLLAEGPWKASTENLESALALVRGRPFAGSHPRYYTWAERLRQRLISEIADVSYELTRRRIMDGRWRAAEESVVTGLAIEPVDERLWRMRILAAHESRSTAAEAEAVERLLTITSELECDLEPETDRLLEALKDPRAVLEDLMVNES